MKGVLEAYHSARLPDFPPALKSFPLSSPKGYRSKVFSLPPPLTSWRFFRCLLLLTAFMLCGPFHSKDLCLFGEKTFSHEAPGGWNSWAVGRRNPGSDSRPSRHTGAYSCREGSASRCSPQGVLSALCMGRQGGQHCDALAKQGGGASFSSYVTISLENVIGISGVHESVNWRYSLSIAWPLLRALWYTYAFACDLNPTYGWGVELFCKIWCRLLEPSEISSALIPNIVIYYLHFTRSNSLKFNSVSTFEHLLGTVRCPGICNYFHKCNSMWLGLW